MLSVVGIVAMNALGFGVMWLCVQFAEAKQAKKIAAYNAKALAAYRLRYGYEGVEV